MSHSPAISVIIPVYNVESWLRRAVGSLQNQTCTSYEILLVDDGSTDGSGALCDKLADDDVRIRVIHQENQGAAAARNAAIEIARGDYLYFMDGDDWCDRTMLKDMYRVASERNLDLLITGFTIDTYYDDEGKYYRELRNAPDRIFESQEEFRANACQLFDAQLLYAPWNKLYRRSYIKEKGIRFPGTFWDDLPFNLDVMRDVERVGCIDGHYYHFLRARAESENTKYRPDMYDKREEEHRWMNELYAYWNLDSPEIEEFLARRYAERLVGCIENVTNRNCTLSKEEKRAAIKQMISTSHAREALKKARPRTEDDVPGIGSLAYGQHHAHHDGKRIDKLGAPKQHQPFRTPKSKPLIKSSQMRALSFPCAQGITTKAHQPRTIREARKTHCNQLLLVPGSECAPHGGVGLGLEPQKPL